MEEIQILEQMRAELLRQVSALDFAINTLQQIRADLTPTSASTDMPTGTVSPPRRAKRTISRLTDAELAAIPDYNPGRGGIRIDD